MTAEPLAPSAVAPLLRAAADTIRAEIGALSPAMLAWHPAPGEWCVKEVLGHLAEHQRPGLPGRVPTILAGQSPKLEGWDQEAVARERGDCAREARELVDELGRMRADSVTLVAGLKPADLSWGGQHPKVGFLTVADLLHEWVHHDRNHIRQMLANVQAFAWPNMGNAQRFSVPSPS